MVAILSDEVEHPDAKTRTAKMRAIRGKIIMWRFVFAELNDHGFGLIDVVIGNLDSCYDE